MRIYLISIDSTSIIYSYILQSFSLIKSLNPTNPHIYIKKHETYTQGDIVDYLDNKGIKGGERAYNQTSTTINIFNWKSALKEEITIFIKQ